MRIRLGAVLSTAIIIGVGFIVLIGLLVGDNLGALSTLVTQLGFREMAWIALQIVTVTLALTIFLGILNLLTVNFRRIAKRGTGFIYSGVVIATFAFAVIAYALKQTDVSKLLLEHVQISIESALSALILFALVFGAATVTRRRTTWAGLLFVCVVVIVLIGAIPLTPFADITRLSDWLMAVPVSGGARGILLGIALATTVTGMRVLIGQDRSYRE